MPADRTTDDVRAVQVAAAHREHPEFRQLLGDVAVEPRSASSGPSWSPAPLPTAMTSTAARGAKDGDACDTNCTLPGHGNGIVDPGEQCGDGNLTDGDACENDSTLPRCGNTILDVGEQCDDGNSINGDACDTNCTTKLSARLRPCQPPAAMASAAAASYSTAISVSTA